MKPLTTPPKIIRSGPNWDVFAGPTPQGGVEALFLYSDDNGNPVSAKQATRCEIQEFAADGSILPMRTTGIMNGGIGNSA